MALVRVVDVAAALAGVREHLLLGVVAHLAEARERRHVEVHRAARLVGVAAVEHHADEAADVGDGRRGPRLGEHRQHVERGHVLVEALHLAGGQVEVVHAELARLGEERIVDVGDVAHAYGRRGRGRCSRRCSTSYWTYTVAWPRWVASYGVMPHVYIVTSGPGSKGTTAWRAVS